MPQGVYLSFADSRRTPKNSEKETLDAYLLEQQAVQVPTMGGSRINEFYVLGGVGISVQYEHDPSTENIHNLEISMNAFSHAVLVQAKDDITSKIPGLCVVKLE